MKRTLRLLARVDETLWTTLVEPIRRALQNRLVILVIVVVDIIGLIQLPGDALAVVLVTIFGLGVLPRILGATLGTPHG